MGKERKINKKAKIYGCMLLMAAGLLTGCNGKTASTTEEPSEQQTTEESTGEEKTTEGQVASPDEMAEPSDVVEEGMTPVYGSAVADGTYEVKVDSSSSMFKITKCELTVKDGTMTAVMTMSGTGYLKLYMGTGSEAAAASEDSYIPFEENENGEHTFTVPVEALDMGIACSAFSKKKEKWYDRVLVFRADSLPPEALGSENIVTGESLGLKDGEYTVSVVLEGGSGKASIDSPAKLTVAEGGKQITAVLVWGSPNYDYMVVDGEKYLPVNSQGNSTFEIPVKGFDCNIPVTADTTAMSTPHEIEYTLVFDSKSIEAVK